MPRSLKGEGEPQILGFGERPDERPAHPAGGACHGYA
jgi:hypothetical protein